MTSTLPSEILSMVLDNIGEDRDYNTLFQCALASRFLAQHALVVLYRIYETSPLRGGGTEDEQFKSQTHQPQSRRSIFASTSLKGEQNPTLRKWIILWRSIVLSTLEAGMTYLPYYTFLRYLDLDDLGNLLGMGNAVKDELFTPELAEFVSKDYVVEGNKRRRSARTPPDNEWMKVKLGSAIVRQNPLIRGMSCDVPPSTLIEWVAGLPQLQSLTLWSGAALSQQTGENISSHCHDFKQLTIYSWQDKQQTTAQADSEDFFNTLRPNSLESFEILSFSDLGPRSIIALGTQINSLVELKLTYLNIETIRELPSLGALPRLEVLSLTDSKPTARNEEFHETVAEVTQWIYSCMKLKHLTLRKFMDDITLLSTVLTSPDIQLTSLTFAGFQLYNRREFLEALGNQSSLQYLYLRGEGSDDSLDNVQLVSALTMLPNIRDLELKDVSDGFVMEQVEILTASLPNLERLWISGEAVNDSIWPAFLNLPKLKGLSIFAFSNFTAKGVVGFISKLGEGNRGFNLSIMNGMSAHEFLDETQAMIREVLAEKLDGSFDFGLAQEEFSEPDSDIDLSD
ncbi:hypothetical protein BJY04DRAFT_191329 [Aspergillus karnatakaensis]|uniref:uncharacterized protein n=1 Tax=Aspergillus karnatakaensis TaxID=1810916 RepID=UPI003CCCBCBC